MFAFRKSDGAAFICGAEDVCRISDGSSTPYLVEPRLVEEFLKPVEPKYNWACAIFDRCQVDPDAVFVIAGFAAFVTCCAPAGLRISARAMEDNLKITATLMDRMGLFPEKPPELGDRSVAEMISEGSLLFEADPKYPQAVGINGILDRTIAYGNFHWDILINRFPDSPFFTSDFPIAIEPCRDLRIVNRIVPLTPSLAIRICPRVELSGKKLNATFENFSYTFLKPSRTEILDLNRTIVRSAEDLVFYPLSAEWVPRFVRKHSRYRVENDTIDIPDGTGFLSVTRTVVREPRNGGRASTKV